MAINKCTLAAIAVSLLLSGSEGFMPATMTANNKPSTSKVALKSVTAAAAAAAIVLQAGAAPVSAAMFDVTPEVGTVQQQSVGWGMPNPSKDPKNKCSCY
jgi:hypothetical protein